MIMATATSASGQKWEGRWDQLKGKVKSVWGSITDDDLTKAQGDYEKLIGVLKEKTGKTREQLEEALNKD
jgi:uncharacterized protein YjbJ (UPF0337 family)